jgi:hypothetical protein
MIIEITDKFYRANFYFYLILLSKGWMVTRNTKIVTEIMRNYFYWVALLAFYIPDAFIRSDFYSFYVIPIKNLIGLGVVYMFIVTLSKRSLVSIRNTSATGISLSLDHVNILMYKRNLIRNCLLLSWINLMLYFLISGYLNIWGHKQFQTAYYMLIDNIIITLYIVIFRPRKFRIFDSNLLRRSIVDGYFFEFRLTLNQKELKHEDYGVILQKDKISTSEILTSSWDTSEQDIPYVVINPYIEDNSEHFLNTFFNSMAIAEESNKNDDFIN